MQDTLSPRGETAAGRGFRLGGLCVNPITGLIDGPGGTEQADPKVMEVFAALAARPGELVTREELLDSVWPDRVVSDDVLSRCMYQLRRHLVAASGDEALHKLVETLPRRGYRLNGKVVPNIQGRDAGRPWRRWPAAAMALALAVATGWWGWERIEGKQTRPPPAATMPVVAVLPFVDLSAEGNQEYFADGVSEELINTLARIPSLRVIARTSTFQFKGQNPDIATVTGKLNATHVLEGAVRNTGNRVRVSTQLINAADSHHLWSDTFERELDDIFAIQDEIALAVAQALELNLAPADVDDGTPAPGAAYAHFLQGQFLLNRRGPGDLEGAAARYRQALEIDPGFPRPWAGLAGVYMIQTANGEVPEADGFALTHDAAQRALALDPKLAEAHFRIARNYDWQGEREAAAPHWEAVRRYGENSPLILSVLAGQSSEDGRLDEAIELQQQAIALDPLSFVLHANQADYLLAAGRLSESREAARAALALRPEHSADAERNTTRTLIAVSVLDGRAADALPLLEDSPMDIPWRDMYAALIFDALERRAEAEAIIERMARAEDFVGAVRLAQVFAHRGEKDAAFAWLETALDRLEPDASRVRRAVLYSEFHISPFLRPLKNDLRWQQWQDEFCSGLR